MSEKKEIQKKYKHINNNLYQIGFNKLDSHKPSKKTISQTTETSSTPENSGPEKTQEENVKKNFKNLTHLQMQFRSAICELEELIKN